VLTPEQAAQQIDQYDFRFNPDVGGVCAMATLATAGLSPDAPHCLLTLPLDPLELTSSAVAQSLSGTDYAISLLGTPDTPGLLEVAQTLGASPSSDLLLMGLPEERPGEVFAMAPTYYLHPVDAPHDVHAAFSLRLLCVRQGQDLCLFVDPLHAMGPDGPQGPAAAALLGAAAAQAAGQLVSTCVFDAQQSWNLLYFLPDIAPPGPELTDQEAFHDHVALAFVDAFPDQAITEIECDQARVDCIDLDPEEPTYWVEHLQSRASVMVFVAGQPLNRPDTTGAFQALQQRLPRLAELAG
jgi:hypothetical protein